MPVKRGKAMLGTRLSLRTRKANLSPSGDHQCATWVWRISSVQRDKQDEMHSSKSSLKFNITQNYIFSFYSFKYKVYFPSEHTVCFTAHYELTLILRLRCRWYEEIKINCTKSMKLSEIIHLCSSVFPSSAFHCTKLCFLVSSLLP